MKFILIPLIVYFFNQVVKLVFLLASRRRIYGELFSWAFIWVGQFPSAHAAVLASCVILIWSQYGVNSLFGLSLFVSLIFLYGFLEDRKRQSLFESYFDKSEDPALKQIARDKILMDFSGHTLLDFAVGIFEGVILTILLLKFVF